MARTLWAISRVADKMLAELNARPRHCRPAHPAAVRLSQVSHQCRPHQGGPGRIHRARHRQQHVDLAQRQLSGDANVLSQSEERRLLQSGRANAAIRHPVAAGSPKYSRSVGPNQKRPGILADVASIQRTSELASINHYNIRRVVDIYACGAGSGPRRGRPRVDRIVDANEKLFRAAAS